MLLFKKQHIAPILTGAKTETRRIWPKGPRVRVGAVHQCRTSLFGEPFARVRVTGLRRERLGDMTDSDAYLEGYDSLEEFYGAWLEINGSWNPQQMVYVVDFEVIDNTALTSREGAQS